MYKLIVDKRAITDLQEIKRWYNECQNGLGNKFTAQAKKQINNLKINPNSFAVRYSDVRCMVVFKYPYMVHYRVKSELEKVIVIAVFSAQRDPDLWNKRLDEIDSE